LPLSINFAALPDLRELREPLRAICAGLGLKGSVLLAHEGINGTVAGTPDCINAFVGELQRGALFRRPARQSRAEILGKFDHAVRRMKVRLKKEIVTLGAADADPTGRSAPMSILPTGTR